MLELPQEMHAIVIHLIGKEVLMVYSNVGCHGEWQQGAGSHCVIRLQIYGPEVCEESSSINCTMNAANQHEAHMPDLTS